MSGFDDAEAPVAEAVPADQSPRTLGFDGYAGATDPRERHDDLLVETGAEVYTEETYAEHAAMEAYRSGWVATGFVLDDDDRVLLVYHEDHDEWTAPGGTLHPAETLHEGLRREIREEAGVTADPIRPHAVTEWIARNEAAPSTEWTGFKVAFFEVTLETETAPTAAASTELGVDDEEITDVDWFGHLPENTFNRDLNVRILDRIRAE